MVEDPIDELGPVDYLVIEFPAGKSSFTGEMAEELTSLVDKGIIRILDLLIIAKGDDGSVAGALVWENVWAAPFASAARRAGGQLVASGRIPIQAIVASMEAEEADMSEGA